MFDLNFIAFAQEATEAAEELTFMQKYSSMIMMVVIIFVFYFIVIRPQKKKQQELQEQLKQLKAGDKVILTSGIYGVITSTGENNSYYVTIANGVKIHVVQAAIAGKVDDNVQTAEKK